MLSKETDATWLVDLPPQSRLAVAASAILVVVFGAAAPFARQPIPELNALFPSLSVTDLITSVLLFAQLSIFALLVLASGYLFTPKDKSQAPKGR